MHEINVKNAIDIQPRKERTLKPYDSCLEAITQVAPTATGLNKARTVTEMCCRNASKVLYTLQNSSNKCSSVFHINDCLVAKNSSCNSNSSSSKMPAKNKCKQLKLPEQHKTSAAHNCAYECCNSKWLNATNLTNCKTKSNANNVTRRPQAHRSHQCGNNNTDSVWVEKHQNCWYGCMLFRSNCSLLVHITLLMLTLIPTIDTAISDTKVMQLGQSTSANTTTMTRTSSIAAVAGAATTTTATMMPLHVNDISREQSTTATTTTNSTLSRAITNLSTTTAVVAAALATTNKTATYVTSNLTEAEQNSLQQIMPNTSGDSSGGSGSGSISNDVSSLSGSGINLFSYSLTSLQLQQAEASSLMTKTNTNTTTSSVASNQDEFVNKITTGKNKNKSKIVESQSHPSALDATMTTTGVVVSDIITSEHETNSQAATAAQAFEANVENAVNGNANNIDNFDIEEHQNNNYNADDSVTEQHEDNANQNTADDSDANELSQSSAASKAATDALTKGFSIPTFLPPFPVFAAADLPMYAAQAKAAAAAAAALTTTQDPTQTQTQDIFAEQVEHQQPMSPYDEEQLYLDILNGKQPASAAGRNLTLPSTNLTVQLGSHAYLPCHIRRLQNKPVSWVRVRDGHILSVDQTTFIADQRFQSMFQDDLEYTWSLQIKYVQETDEGWYECQVSTEPKMSAKVYLGVVVPKTELIGDQNRFVKAGSKVALHCIVRGTLDPPTYIIWYHGKTQISDDNKMGWYTEIDRNIFGNSSVNQNTIGSLIIPFVRKKDSGNYTCQPSNSAAVSVDLHVLSGEYSASAIKSGAGGMAAHRTTLAISLPKTIMEALQGVLSGETTSKTKTTIACTYQINTLYLFLLFYLLWKT